MGAGSDDFVYAAYQWNADETAAELVPEVGAADVAPVASAPSAPLHDIPGTGTCKYCHGALPAHVLGIGTVQSSHEPGGLSLAELVAADRLTAAPAAPYVVPGNAVEQAALGYLHANCGHCHNDTDTGVTAPRFVLRLLVGDDDTGGDARLRDGGQRASHLAERAPRGRRLSYTRRRSREQRAVLPNRRPRPRAADAAHRQRACGRTRPRDLEAVD